MSGGGRVRDGQGSLNYGAINSFDRAEREAFRDDLADVLAVERASFSSFFRDLLGRGSMEERDDEAREHVDEAFRECECEEISRWVDIGLKRGTFDGTREVAESLLYGERPFSDQWFRPFLEANPGWYKDIYISEDGDMLELRPSEADRIEDYETAFENAMQSCLAYLHNVRALEDREDLDAPDLSIVVSDDHRVEEERPWPYAVVERVEETDGGLLDRIVEQWRVGRSFSEAYREEGLSYASAEEGRADANYVVREDGPVMVDVGEYVNGRSKEVLDESGYLPDHWRAMCRPGYWG